MRCITVAVLIFCGGCRFSVHALDNNGNGSDMGVGGDLATGDPDLAGVVVDLAGADLTSGPDIADPCGAPPPLGAGNIAAQCVIGSPPVIDGNLNDWPIGSMISMTHVTSAQSSGTWDPSESLNDADCAARFFVKWDLNYLYVAAAITDDIRQTPNNTGPGLTDNDALEIFVDGAHNRTQPYDPTDWQLVFSADNKKAAFQTGTIQNPFPAGVMFALGGTSPSWNIEIAIPWSIVGGGGTSGRVLGLDVKLDDNDSGNSTRERGLVMYYTATGGGSPACTAPYCRTDAFGAVQLQGR